MNFHYFTPQILNRIAILVFIVVAGFATGVFSQIYVVGHYEIDRSIFSSAVTALLPYGDVVYVNDASGIPDYGNNYIIGVSAKETPHVVDRIDPHFDAGGSYAVLNGHLYWLHGSTWAQLREYSIINNPSSPALIAEHGPVGRPGGSWVTSRMLAVGDTLIIVSQDLGYGATSGDIHVHLYRPVPGQDLELLDTLKWTNETTNTGLSIISQDSTLFLRTPYSVLSVRIENDELSMIAELTGFSRSGVLMRNIGLHGDRLVVADIISSPEIGVADERELVVIDTSDPASLNILERIDVDRVPSHVVTHARHLYCWYNDGALVVRDVESDGLLIVHSTNLSVRGTGNIVSDGDYVYAGHGAGMLILSESSSPPPISPPMPGSLNYPSSSSTGSYTVNWGSSSGATSYRLERSNNGGVIWSEVYSGSATSYSENVGNGSYRYRVRAENSAGNSSWRTGTNDCVVNIPTAPPMPVSLNYPLSSSTGSYTVNWGASSGATSYRLERSSDGGVSWSEVYSGSATSYSENVSNGSYRYRVRAARGSGSGDRGQSVHLNILGLRGMPMFYDQLMIGRRVNVIQAVRTFLDPGDPVRRNLQARMFKCTD